LLLSIIGLAGCGKSTCAGLVEKIAAERGMTHARVKLAAPLYELQAQVYAVAGVTVRAGTQDQVLMEDLAGALRRIEPSSLVHNFHRRLAEVDADIVVNDDLRDPHVDAVDLRRRGFRIVRVTADDGVRTARLDARGDLTRSDRSTAEIDLIEPDVVVDNSGDLAAFRRRVEEILEEWL
jgi:dephospho-CoA kinase